MSIYRNLITLCFAAVFTLGLAACGGGGDGTTTTTMPDPDPVAVEQKAIDDAIAAAAAAAALVTDAATDEVVGAADMAVAAAMTAIDGASHITAGAVTAARARLATISGQLTAAKASRTMTMDLASQRMAISDALAAARTAVDAVMDDSDDATVTAAEEAIAAVNTAIAAAGDIPSSEANAARTSVAGLQSDLDDAKDSRQTAMDEAERRRLAAEDRDKAAEAAEDAIEEALEAVAALSESSTDAEVQAAQALIDAATTAAGNAALDMAQMEGFNTRIGAIEDDFGEVGAARRVIEMAKTAAMNAATAADSAADAAEGAASAQEANKAYDAASYALAKNAAERARAASDAAAAASTVAQAANTRSEAEAQRDIAQRHQETAEAERANAVKYANMVLAAKTTADDDATAAKNKATANKVANTKKTAIATEADSNTAAARPFDLGDAPADPTAPTDAENYVVTVKHKDGAVEVTVVDGEFPAKNDPKYEQTETFGDGQMLVRNIGTERKIIVLHSDIEAPDRKAFSSVYSFTVDRDTDTTAMDTYAVLAADNGKIASSSFPSGADLEKSYDVYDSTGTAAAKAKSQFSGTFDGASGTYRCVATGGCTVSTDDEGKFEALTVGEWEFTPAAGATVAVADSDYMTYGFWLDTTTKDGAVTSYDIVQTFATSSLDRSTGLGSVTGTASYAGGAAGVYVHETKKEDGSLDTATSGRFTADVSLKAYFTGDPLRTDGTIDGTISDFDLEGGPANSWSVNVSATGIATDAGFTGNASGMTGNTGSLSGRFHGAGTETTDAPPVLVGEFNANFVNGNVAGAFGARKQP